MATQSWFSENWCALMPMARKKNIRKRATCNDSAIWALWRLDVIVLCKQKTTKDCFCCVLKDSMMRRLTASNTSKLSSLFPLSNHVTASYYFLWAKHYERLLMSHAQRFNSKSTSNFKCVWASTSISISTCLHRSPWCILAHWLVIESFCVVQCLSKGSQYGLVRRAV